MKKIFLSLLFLFFVNLSFAQCFFGFEHINTPSGDSAVVIKKYGFPNYTEFRLIQSANSDGTMVTIDTTISSQLNDTLLFDSQADSIGWLNLSAVSSAGDTLGFFKAEISVGFPQDIGLISYIPPSSISSLDGEIVFYTDTILMPNSGYIINDETSIASEFDSIPAGLTEGFFHGGAFEIWTFRMIIGNPEDWVDVESGTMTCPIGVNLATDQSTCDGEAYIGQVQNGAAPYTYDWNASGTFSTDTVITDLCVGNHFVTIKDQNDDIRTCAFAMGSLDNGYFPPTQTNDTTIHTFTDYCMDTIVDSVTVVGSEVIDSVSFSVVWSFYSGTNLVDQILDTFQITIPNGTYDNIELYLHLVCDGDTLKASSSVYSTYGYVSLPFSETGYLGLDEIDVNSEVIAYPNPVDELLNIQLNNSQIKKILVLNNLGQEVDVEISKIKSDHFTIDFNGLSKGNFIIQVVTGDEVTHIKKVVKK